MKNQLTKGGIPYPYGEVTVSSSHKHLVEKQGLRFWSPESFSIILRGVQLAKVENIWGQEKTKYDNANHSIQVNHMVM